MVECEENGISYKIPVSLSELTDKEVFHRQNASVMFSGIWIIRLQNFGFNS